ncbi:filamentous hemagglutinin N-terminal domain-containing protein [Candidatus Halobeggiatoa sp. HSG11]|nr:filamentous hemagglutinin N-terminal domain-containing protein [Candidatus Halobeggiatoa sp. HSG11]
MKYLPIASLLIISLSTNAEIITDGTLSQNINLPGPDFQIGADLGQQHGGNLFHSFHDFNLNSSESATFSGPNSVQNILSRVTGGNSSNIDGLIRSTIPNANFYFLNPYGIMFGPNAQLDIQGSFHASTADYLRLGENGRFDARSPSDSLLTVAPVESFGFLTDSAAKIIAQDSQLSVPDYHTLSLIGGDLSLNGQLVFDEAGEQQFNTIAYPIIPISIPLYSNQLLAQSGRINLVSVAGKGEVKPTESSIDLSANMQGGKIVVDKTDINVNGENGNIFIRGGQFEFHSSHIENQNLGNQKGGLIDIQVDNFVMQGGKNYAGIQAESRNVGQGGTIKIHAKHINASNGFFIAANNYHLGDTGIVFIQADTLSMSGKFIPELGTPSGIFSVVISINSAIKKNNTGSINLEANQIKLVNGAEVGTLTFGPKDGANINVKVYDSLIISKAAIEKAFGFDNASLPSGFVSNSFSGSSLLSNFGIDYPNNGDGGNIKIEAGRIDMKEGGIITSGSTRANAGHISIKAEQLTLTDIEDMALLDTLGRENTSITSSTRGSGAGGNIQINLSGDLTIHRNLEDSTLLPDRIKDTSILPRIITASSSKQPDAGMAGTIFIQANSIKLNGHGRITTDSKNGSGGNITIDIPNLLYLQEGEITTSVYAGKGNGGNITIENPTFVVLNQGQIKAQADAGHGGDIHIKSEQFVTSPDSLISASSNLGLDGEVNIESLDIDMEGFLVVLSDETVEASSLIKQPCSMRGSSFFVQKINGSPQTPYDYHPSTYLPEVDKKVKTISKKIGEKLAFSTCKHF